MGFIVDGRYVGLRNGWEAKLGRSVTLNPQGLLGPGLGKSSTAQAANSAASLPGTPLHHFDLSNQATVWADEAATIAITDGTEIARVDNLGSATGTVNLTQGTASKRPDWTDGHINGLAVGTWDGSSHNLRAALSDGDSAGNFTAAIVLAPGAAGSALYAVAWSPHQLSLRLSGTNVLTAGVAGAVLANSAAYTPDNAYAMVVSDDGADAQLAEYTHDASDDTASTTSSGPADAQNFDMGSFIDALGYYPGDIGEFVFYNTKLSAADTQQLKDYITDKWGLTWA